MKTALGSAAALALLALNPQPAAAAEDLRAVETGRNTAAFAGIRLRLDLNDSRPAIPTARLTLGLVDHDGDRGASGRRFRGSALELGLARNGRADFYVGGQRLSDVRQRLGVAPAAAVVLGLGAVAAGAVVVSSLDEELHRKQCLLPEQELCGE